MKCKYCNGTGYYFSYNDFYQHQCICSIEKSTIEIKRNKITKGKHKVLVDGYETYILEEDNIYRKIKDESKYIMDESMVMSIAHLFLEMQDYDSMMEYASLLHGLDLGN